MSTGEHSTTIKPLSGTIESNDDNTRVRVNVQTLKKKIEEGEHYFTPEELDAIWWDGYEHGSIDSAYDYYDKGYSAAIDDYGLYWR